jgi:PST family polysaccharide transporter
MFKDYGLQPMLRLTGNKFLGIVVSLHVTQFASFILPALTVPFLARTLTLPSWGQLAFAQSFAAFIAIFIEYGFAFSGTQQAAEARSDPRSLSKVLAAVQAGKLILALAAGLLCCLVRPYLPYLAESGALFWSSLLWATGQAFSLTWFFLGIECIATATAVDLFFKTLAACALFVLIRGPGDTWKVVAIQASASLLSAGVCIAVARRRAPLEWPCWAAVKEALRHGREAMLFRASESVYTSGSPMLLGLLSGSASVGLYAGAEKICRGVMLPLLEPVQRSLYARITNTIGSSREKAQITARKGAIWSGLMALALSAGIFNAAPLVIRLALGQEYLPATNMLRVLCLVPPAVALKWSIGLHWMMTAGMKRQFSRIVMGSSLLHIGLAICLVWFLGAMGMAITAAVVEIAIPLACYLSVRQMSSTSFSEMQPLVLTTASGNGAQ